jgi:hypothetical protein
MLIVDSQIHLWEKGAPSAHHRQEPYSAEQAISGMDQAGLDRGLTHPVLWDPDSNELAALEPLCDYGLVLPRRPERPRHRRALEGAKE